MAHEVFISYAVEDREVADKVCGALEHDGIKCWIAPRDVPYGADYEEAIVDAIASSYALVLIFSSHSNASPHVKREIQSAYAEGSMTKIVPLRIEDIEYNKALRYYLRSARWLDASAPPLEQHLDRLVEHVRSHLARAGGTATQGERASILSGPITTPSAAAETRSAPGWYQYSAKTGELRRIRTPSVWWGVVGVAAFLLLGAVMNAVYSSRGGGGENINMHPANVNANATPTPQRTATPPPAQAESKLQPLATPTPEATGVKTTPEQREPARTRRANALGNTPLRSSPTPSKYNDNSEPQAMPTPSTKNTSTPNDKPTPERKPDDDDKLPEFGTRQLPR